jgi:GAF domain-containing protein/HAMP domain-containing protein
MAHADVVGSGIVYLVDDANQVVAHANPSVALQQKTTILPTENGYTTGLDGEPVAMAREDIVLNGRTFSVVAEQPESEALSLPINNAIISGVIALVMALLAGLIGVGVANFITNPIGKLSEAAQAVSQGDFSRQVLVERQNEIGTLAIAFNSMTSQLRNLIGNLEQRVADRTKALATSSEVSRRLSTILNQKELVIEVVEQVKEAFGYYHAHIYLVVGDDFFWAGVTGAAGAVMLAEGHKIPKGRGLVGRAAESNETVLVPDTTRDPEWLPNPLLPETKSEVAIPISVGDQVLGVLDVQHDETNGLGQEDVDALQSIANQVAVAIQNIHQYEKTQKMAADLGVVANVGIATSTITEAGHLLQEVVDLSKRSFNLYHAHIYLLNETGDVLELASGAGEVGRKMVAEGRQIPLNSEQSLVARAARTQEGVVVNDVQTDPDFLPNPLLPKTRAEMAVPMLVSGKVVGVLDVQSEQVNRFSDTDVDIQTTLASQIAVALQNARSFTNAQKQAERESKLNAIAQNIQSTTTIEEAMQITARELGHALGKRQTLVALEPAALVNEIKEQ